MENPFAEIIEQINKVQTYMLEGVKELLEDMMIPK